MKTYYCIECGDAFDAIRQREFCDLDCVDDYEERTGQKVTLDPLLAQQDFALHAEAVQLDRQFGTSEVNHARLLPVVRLGQTVQVCARECTNDELQALADTWSFDEPAEAKSRWDYIELDRL